MGRVGSARLCRKGLVLGPGLRLAGTNRVSGERRTFNAEHSISKARISKKDKVEGEKPKE